MRPLLYIAVRRFINSLKRIPKSPRLLLPTLFFLLFFLVGIPGYRAGYPPAGGPLPALTPRELVEGAPGAFIAAIRALLVLSLFGSVATAFGEGSLFFSPSDVDFLFPAPLPRRAVLLFKMAGTYASLLFPTIYFPCVLGGSLAGQRGATPLVYWPGMAGAWLFLLATANATQIILLNRPDDEDDSTRRKIQKVLRGLGFALLLLAGFVAYRLTNGEGGVGLRALLRAVNSGLASALLLPIAWASDLFLVAFQGWSVEEGGKLAALAALAAGSFALLFSRERDFYEGAIEVAARRQRLTAALQGGQGAEMVLRMAGEGKLTRGRGAHSLGALLARVLRPFGGGALAVFWRDLVSTTRTPLRSWISLLTLSALPALLGRGIGGRRDDTGVLFWMVLFTLNVSNIFLLSIRTTLRRADITKALPIAPARFLLGETALSILLLTALGWVSLLLMVALGTGRGPLTLVAFLTLPTLASLVLLVQTCFVLVYPNRNDQAQNTIGSLLGFLGSTLALLPTIAVGWGLFLSSTGGPPLRRVFVMALGISLTNLVAAGAALSFATFLWQRFDPTD